LSRGLFGHRRRPMFFFTAYRSSDYLYIKFNILLSRLLLFGSHLETPYIRGAGCVFAHAKWW